MINKKFFSLYTIIKIENLITKFLKNNKTTLLDKLKIIENEYI